MPVRHEVAAGALPFGLHAVQQAIDEADLGGDLAQRLTDLWKCDDAVRFGDAMGESGEKAHLHKQPDLALIVLVDMRRRPVELLLRHLGVLVHEYPLPRHLDVIEVERGVWLRQSAVEPDAALSSY